MKKTIIFFPVIVLLIAAVYYWWSTSVNQPPHGIILISLDALRADHLGIYGYHHDTSPSIDTFAKESTLFENAVVQSTWTLPSHMSIMTSLYPSFHGVVDISTTSLSDNSVKLSELLSQGGYKTAAFVDGGFVSGHWGFHHGFDTYDDQGGGIAKILPKVQKWLSNNKTNPFFIFIHSYDIHSPYNPPPPYSSMFHDFECAGTRVPSINTLDAAIRNDLMLSDHDLRHFIAFYDGGICYTDNKIGEFLFFLKSSGLADKSLIIITSDHGEEFNEHNSLCHRQLYYRPNLHVPLIMHLPSYPKKEIRINELVQSVDLLPTILEIAGLPPYAKAQGRSLLPMIRRHKNVMRNIVWKASQYFDNNTTFSFAELKTEAQEELQSIISSDGYQMIYNVKTHKRQLFNLNNDPLAQHNIAEEHNYITQHLLSALRQLYDTKPKHMITRNVVLHSEAREQLRALGYIDLPEPTQMEENVDGKDSSKSGYNNFARPVSHQKDTDGDGVKDVSDNCPDIVNPQQKDHDQDGIGVKCDTCVDTDWDGYGDPGYPNTCKKDNCPFIFNPRQKDADEDGVGNLCDCEGDIDRDGDVDGSDLMQLMKDRGRKNCSKSDPCSGDLDCDGDVDDSDFNVFKNYKGRTNCQQSDFQCSYLSL